MGDIVLALVVLIVVWLLLLAAGVYATRAALRRRNQVVSGVPSPAPIGWLTSSRREAVIHRRLRAAGRRLELLPSNGGLDDVITRLRIELVEIDGHLVTVSRRPKHVRRADRREIADHVTAIEDLVRRAEERSRTDTGSLAELAERLDALEAADDELRGLEPG